MKCWNCQAELIWGSDHVMEDCEDFVVESNFSCPECHAFVLFYHAVEPDTGLDVPQIVRDLETIGLNVMTDVPEIKAKA